MRFSAKEDIAADAAAVFAALTDFEVYERMAMRRGAEVTRTDSGRPGGIGATWNVQFSFRRKRRAATIRLTAADPPARLAFEAGSANLEVTLDLSLVVLSRTRTRLVAVTEVKPRSLKARLLIQSARLARRRLDRRYAARLHALVAEVETRLGRQPQAEAQWRRGSAG